MGKGRVWGRSDPSDKGETIESLQSAVRLVSNRVAGPIPPWQIALLPHLLAAALLQARFRSMWERYCRGVQAIVYVVDSADLDSVDTSAKELQELLSKPSLTGIPLLVLGNKNDLP